MTVTVDATALLSGRKLVWVWHADEVLGPVQTNLSSFIDDLIAHGIGGAIFKHDDGGAIFTDAADALSLHPNNMRAVKSAMRERGLLFGLWGYHYGARQTAERQIVARAMAEFMPDLYVLDWEVELERNFRLEEDHLTLTRHLQGIVEERDRLSPETVLLHAPLPQPRFHIPWQYAAFNTLFDGMMPQIYHRAMELDPVRALFLSYSDYATFNLTGVPIFPIGQGYSVSADEVRAWGEAAVKTFFAESLSWWKYEDLRADVKRAIGQIGLIGLSRDGSGGDEMRRVNNRHRGFRRLGHLRCKLAPGRYEINLADGPGGEDWTEGDRLLERDRRVVVDLEFSPVRDEDATDPVERRPSIIVLDGNGDYAGALDDLIGWRLRFPVYPDATPRRRIWIEVGGGEVRPVLVGVLEAG